MYSAERHFVTTAHTQLRALDGSGKKGEQQELKSIAQIEAAIGDIKQAAGSVKARAVYRAALLCEDILARTGSGTDVNFRTAYARLKSLVGLYANGLFEIDPEFKSLLDGRQPAHFQQPTPVAPDTIRKNKPSPACLVAANQNAANVLKPLLRLVKDDGPKDALDFLSTFSAKQDADMVKKPAQLKMTNVRFDGIMRKVTNLALAEARAKAKNVSISYAADFETIDHSIAHGTQNLLYVACLSIIRRGLTIDGDMTSSMSRNWQISITGETRGQNLALIISWRGQDIAGFLSADRTRQTLRDCGAHGSQNTVASESGKPDTQVLEFTYPLIKQTAAPTNIIPKQVREG